MNDLFGASDGSVAAKRPLADRLRPAKIEDVAGQDHLLGPGMPLGRMIETGKLSSLLLWGPPGTGKTTLARLLAHVGDLAFEQVSAVFSGVADLKKVFEAAKIRRLSGRGTLLFVDEIHRFNRSQQDGFLPYVEDGTIVLVGATTENPSFEINAALLSRMQVFVLKALDDPAKETLLQRAEAELGHPLPVDPAAREALKAMSDGDGRYLLNLVEVLCDLAGDQLLNTQQMAVLLQRRAPAYDKDREGHYNLISALHKCLRGSDADAALYYLARMLVAGEDPLYLVRRLVRFASEDIGLADPQALVQALAAKDAYDFLGSPEGELAIVQATLYLATAPKSNAAYKAEKAAKTVAKQTGSLMPPMHILNAPTKLMKDVGYGTGYQYDHDAEDGFSGQNYFPDGMARQCLYQPKETGFEREIVKRLDYWSKLRGKRGEG